MTDWMKPWRISFLLIAYLSGCDSQSELNGTWKCDQFFCKGELTFSQGWFSKEVRIKTAKIDGVFPVNGIDEQTLRDGRKVLHIAIKDTNGLNMPIYLLEGQLYLGGVYEEDRLNCKCEKTGGTLTQ